MTTSWDVVVGSAVVVVVVVVVGVGTAVLVVLSVVVVSVVGATTQDNRHFKHKMTIPKYHRPTFQEKKNFCDISPILVK